MTGDLIGTTEHGNRVFWCPACRAVHAFGPQWLVSGPADRPTVEGSILTSGSAFNQDGSTRELPLCHSFIEGGKIRYCSDCTHVLAGSTVDMEPLF